MYFLADILSVFLWSVGLVSLSCILWKYQFRMGFYSVLLMLAFVAVATLVFIFCCSWPWFLVWKINGKSFKNQWKMRSILESTSGGLLGALGPLLGSSWASLGHPWGTKVVPKRGSHSDPRQFFLQLCLASCIFFDFWCLLVPQGPFLGGFWTLWGLSWESFSPSGAEI